MSDTATTSGPGRLTPDRTQLQRLNTLWQIIDAPTGGGTLRARLAATMRRLFARVLAKQQEFNASLVDHINRNTPVFDQVTERMEDLLDEIRRHQQMLLAREHRSENVMHALTAKHDELRAAVSTLQQATQNLKREIQRGQIGAGSVSGSGSGSVPVPPPNQLEALDSHKYVGFEDQFRGSSDEIRQRISEYVPIFAGAGDILDIGCGRGEFLKLLREHGISARGIDLNPSMVEVCREQGLDATTSDALDYLRRQPDGSLGGLFAAQVVEHLEPRYLTQLLDAAYDKLRPGAPIVLETINPACWFAFFESYIRDITHVRPLHPDTLKFLLVASGFQQAEIRYREPYPDAEKLQPLTGATVAAGGAPADWAETINANVEKMNRLLFTWMDYAAIARRS